jgi:hypothetical protein
MRKKIGVEANTETSMLCMFTSHGNGYCTNIWKKKKMKDSVLRNNLECSTVFHYQSDLHGLD